jgi:hypothetical protein
MQSLETADRKALWLPLLRRLSERVPEWVVWKNVDSAFYGGGDIDAAAPESAWPTIQNEFVTWAQELGLTPVIVCKHIPGGLNLIAVPPGFATLLEVGVKEKKIWRGTSLFRVCDLLPLIVSDPLGFRRIRPGAEGVLKLLLNATRWNGLPDIHAIAQKHVRELLREDPEGARLCSRVLFSPVRGSLDRACDAVAEEKWDRGALMAVQTWALSRNFFHPMIAARRLWFRATAIKSCAVVSTLLRDYRRVPDDRAAWLQRVAANHSFYGTVSKA